MSTFAHVPGRRVARLRRVCAGLLAGVAAALAQATPPPGLPVPVQQALQRARLSDDAMAVVVADAEPGGRVWASHRADATVNPASVMKLVTTAAALDLLGPAYTWRTDVLTDGPVVEGELRGNLILRGRGDPALVAERLWLLMRRVQGLGVRRIAGDVILDRSAYALGAHDPGAFDGAVLRPYNAGPDALLINYAALVLTLVPDGAAGLARVELEPPLEGVHVPESVPLDVRATCGDWRGKLAIDFTDPSQLLLRGGYPESCGERAWPIAYPDGARFSERAVAGMWRSVGGELQGRVRDGLAPESALLRFSAYSPSLAEVLRNINKYSNNVMAQQLLLTLALEDGGGPGVGYEDARRTVRAWWQRRVGGVWAAPDVDNGAGLSRVAQLQAGGLAAMLQAMYASGRMPELVASLPVSGEDGTMRRSKAAQGRAHIKTGSLRDVFAMAGYVHLDDGRRRVVVGIVNHPRAHDGRAALEALLDWAQGHGGSVLAEE